MNRTRFRMRFAILLLASLWGLGCPSVFATSFSPQPFPETVQDAPVIVHGKIGNSYANWGTGVDGARRIYTYYELALDETIKGKVESPRSIMIREMGGEKDGIGMQVAGTAAFQRGEDVVVFLGNVNPDGSHDVHGMMMGKYSIVRGEDGKEYLDGAGIDNPHEDHGGQGDTHPRSKWSIDSLRTLVRSQEAEKQPTKQGVLATGEPAAKHESDGATAAPQLQPGNGGTLSVPWWVTVIGLTALVSGGGLFAALRRKKSVK